MGLCRPERRRSTDRQGRSIGRYFGPPATWAASDGSAITGTQLAVAPAGDGNIPLQLVKANPASGQGAMSGISHIQRVATRGGVAPAVDLRRRRQGQARSRQVPGRLHLLEGDVVPEPQARYCGPMRIEIEPGVRVFVDVEGAGLVADGPRMRDKPTLILLHGGPGYDHSGFKPLFSQLADIAQIVYVDHRGHGRSDRRPASEWTLDTFADDVVRLCDALGIGKPIVLGQSFGGFVAQRYIARHPAHPGKVILSSTTHHMGLARKLAMFEKLGGLEARDAAKRSGRSRMRRPGPSTTASASATTTPRRKTKRPVSERSSTPTSSSPRPAASSER